MILPHHARWPIIHETAFVASSADLIGEIEIGSQSSVWFQAVIRGDVRPIKIGSRTNIQDHCLLHVTSDKNPLIVGDDVTVGHHGVLHGCTVGNRVLIGMGAILLDDAEIGDDCVIGAGALVTQRKMIPARSLVLGSPARVIRSLTDEEIAQIALSARHYVGEAAEYRRYVFGPEKLGASNRDLETLEFDEGEMP